MKIRENKNIKDKNSNKIKRQVSIITVSLWIFLVAIMITVVIGNIKNTNALENDNVEIYGEIDEFSSTYASSIPPPMLNNIANLSSPFVYINCSDSGEHILQYDDFLDNSAINVSEIVVNTSNTGVSPTIYPYMCEIELNPEFWLNEYNNYANEQGFEKHWIKSIRGVLRLYYNSSRRMWYIYNFSPFYITVSHVKPSIPTINSIVSSNDDEVIKFVCKDSADHVATDTSFENNSAIIAGEIVENDGSDDVSAVLYPWICDIRLNSDYWINLYNNFALNNGFGEHSVTINNDSLRLYYSSNNGKWTYKNSSIPLEIEITHIIKKYMVTYTDGVGDGITVFPDQSYEGLSEGEATPEFEGTPFRKGYIFGGWYPAVNTIISPEDSDENNEIIYTATWQKIIPPDRTELVKILGRDFVKVHCVKNIHDDKFYSTWGGNLDGLYESSIGEVYYSEEQNKYLCDVTLNGEVYNFMYELEPPFGSNEIHHLVKDNNFEEPAIYDEDTQKNITLYYDVEEFKWKVLEEIELPIIFNVTCNLAEVNGLYKVNHEYYLKDENGNMILEGVLDSGAVNVVFKYGKRIIVGVGKEYDKVNIEVDKIFNHNMENVNYTYEYLENSGNITLEPDTLKEITLKYVREEENETKIKAEKIWEDENNKYGKRPENVVLQIKNGEEVVAEMEVSEENNWSCEFVVPKYDKEGNEIEYTVGEKETDANYEKIIDGYKVINKYRVEEEKNENKENNNDIIKNEENVDTSDINIWMYVGIAMVSIVVIVIVIILVKKNNKKSK